MMIQVAEEFTSKNYSCSPWGSNEGAVSDMAKSKILIVEDESSLVDVLSYNLQREGYEVVVAKEGREGLRKAQMILPDLILLDLMLPGISGLEICRELRASTRTARLPILMLTAKAEEPDRITGLELGADDYMTKPFSPRELVLRVKSVLRRAGPAAGKETAHLRAGPVAIDRAPASATAPPCGISSSGGGAIGVCVHGDRASTSSNGA